MNAESVPQHSPGLPGPPLIAAVPGGLPRVCAARNTNPERAGLPRSFGSFRKEPGGRDVAPIFVFPFFRCRFLRTSRVLLVLRKCEMVSNVLQSLCELRISH